MRKLSYSFLVIIACILLFTCTQSPEIKIQESTPPTVNSASDTNPTVNNVDSSNPNVTNIPSNNKTSSNDPQSIQPSPTLDKSAEMRAKNPSKRRVSMDLLVTSFTDKVKNADIIAEIEILDKTRERENPPATYFKAKLNEVFNNKIQEKNKIVEVYQFGTTECTADGSPILVPGDKLITFLKGSDSVYNIWGEYVVMYHILNVGGIDYLVKKFRDKQLDDIEEKAVSETVGKAFMDLRKDNEMCTYYQVLRKDKFIQKLNNEIEKQR